MAKYLVNLGVREPHIWIDLAIQHEYAEYNQSFEMQLDGAAQCVYDMLRGHGKFLSTYMRTLL